MLKFFRKYNKHMLAVFMGLLLIVWLTDDALRAILRSDQTNEAVAKAFGSTIRQSDLQPTYHETEVLNSLFAGLSIQWSAIWQLSLAEQGIPYYMASINREPLSEKEWFMLVETARRQGIDVPAEEINRLKAEMPAANERIESVRSMRRVSLAQIDASIGDLLRVREAASRAAGAVHVTDADIRDVMKRIGEKVRVKFVALPATSFEIKDAPIDEAELKAQFEEYKNVPKGGAGGKRFGYQKEAAVQFEYVTANVGQLVEMIQVSESKAWDYWSKHKADFKHPVPVSQPATTNPADTRPTTRPKTEMKPYDHFDEAKTDVLAKLRNEQAKAEATKLIKEFIAALGHDWAKATAGPDGYLVAPDVVRQPDYLGQMVDAFRNRSYGKCLEIHRSPWRTRSEVSLEMGISSASLTDTRPPLGFRRAVFQVQGLVDKKPSASTPGDEFYLSLYQTCPSVLTDTAGNAYLYRALAVKPAEAPASLDEVREQVLADVRSIQAYKAAEAAARQLSSQAGAAGLEAALAADEAVRTKLGPTLAKVETPDPFAREELPRFAFGGGNMGPTDVPGIGPEPVFIRECFKLGAAKTATQPQRVAVVELESQQRWVVVQWVENVPLREDEYKEKRPQVAMMLHMREMGEFMREYYSPEQIRKRAQWEDVVPKGAPAEPAEASS